MEARDQLCQPPAAAPEEDLRRLSASLEALLFMSGAALSLQDLCELTGREAEEVYLALEMLRRQCEGHAIWVINVAGGFQLATRPEYGEVVARLLQPKRFRLSRAALETLAIVAYRQPVTRPEIEDIRGVNVDGVMETLLQYGLVRECGRRHTPGRPIQYATTDSFLAHFGLGSLEDLPQLEQPPRAAAAPPPQAREGAAPPDGEDNLQPEEPTCESPSQP